MVFALSENGGSARGGARSSHPVLSGALGKSLRAMAREHPGLVYQPPGLVGASHPGVVPESRDRTTKAFMSALILRVIREVGSKTTTLSTPGFRRGFGTTKRWMK